MTLPVKNVFLAEWFNSVKEKQMMKTSRARYTLEFKQEAVRLVQSGQSIASAARALGVVE